MDRYQRLLTEAVFKKVRIRLNEITIQQKYEKEKERTKWDGREFDMICKADPTYNQTNGNVGKYTNWLLSRLDSIDDLNQVKTPLEWFADGVKRGIMNRYGIPTDINKFRSVQEFVDAMKGLMFTDDNKMSQSEYNNRSKLKGQYEVVGSNEYYDVIRPFTFEAERYFGGGTEWCTVGNEDYFDDYGGNEGELYIFYPKNGKKEMKMQFHVDSNSYATYDDNVEVMPKFCITACANMNGLDENFCKRTCDLSDSLGLFPNCDYITIAEAIELVKQGNDINDVFDCVIPCKNSPVLELNGRIYYMRSDGGIIGAKELVNTLEEKVSNNPRFVDLGLSVKWCNFNFGGDSPEEGGAYLAWGETEEKEEYNGKTYDFGKPFEDVGLKYGMGRVPTTEEFKELSELESFWGKYHDISGMYFIGGNGNAIFLPAAGLRTEKNGVRYPQTYGNYWSSDAYSTQGAKCFLFSYNEIKPEMRNYRNLGFSVRLVQG